MKRTSFLLIALTLAVPVILWGQVRIGANEDPHPGAVLDLTNSNNFGLKLPVIGLIKADSLQVGACSTVADGPSAIGMTVYNTNEHTLDGVGVYIWNGTVWKPLWSKGSILRPKMLDVAGGSYIFGAAVQPSNDGVAGDTAWLGSHLVNISSFRMSETPITQGQFEHVMGANPSYYQSSSYQPSSDRAIEHITWYAAIVYCNKLSIMEGKTPCYTVNGVSDWVSLNFSNIPTSEHSDWHTAACDFSANGYRLPTEAEWEYAARGGQKSRSKVTNGVELDYYYAGSNTANDVAWYFGNLPSQSPVAPQPVKKKKPNELGLYDMSGNVLEWCWDWEIYPNDYAIYGSSGDTDPKGPNTGAFRVLRGGVWFDFGNTFSMCRVSYHHCSNPSYTWPYYGFRIVCGAN
ncbi:MAG: formylglycine-generating enzyme family protein [Dysgonamonadaceae bacterium]|nr:formylglycine-generating enzyme family protein [Dysgonamonadaceae bacterium]